MMSNSRSPIFSEFGNSRKMEELMKKGFKKKEEVAKGDDENIFGNHCFLNPKLVGVNDG